MLATMGRAQETVAAATNVRFEYNGFLKAFLCSQASRTVWCLTVNVPSGNVA